MVFLSLVSVTMAMLVVEGFEVVVGVVEVEVDEVVGGGVDVVDGLVVERACSRPPVMV